MVARLAPLGPILVSPDRPGTRIIGAAQGTALRS
jgi:hypothetical protein